MNSSSCQIPDSRFSRMPQENSNGWAVRSSDSQAGHDKFMAIVTQNSAQEPWPTQHRRSHKRRRQSGIFRARAANHRSNRTPSRRKAVDYHSLVCMIGSLLLHTTPYYGTSYFVLLRLATSAVSHHYLLPRHASKAPLRVNPTSDVLTKPQSTRERHVSSGNVRVSLGSLPCSVLIKDEGDPALPYSVLVPVRG